MLVAVVVVQMVFVPHTQEEMAVAEQEAETVLDLQQQITLAVVAAAAHSLQTMVEDLAVLE
jgi:polysaccharide deacetylase 2 family uncharacterized protein YibQ